MMKKFFDFPNEKIEQLKALNYEHLIFRAMPHFVMELMRGYFRLEVEGIENIPKRGPALIAPNHSGYSGFDAMVLTHEIYRATGRPPRVLTHHFWFLSKTTARAASKAGFIEANMENGLKHLRKQNLVVIFPEGETGNFKPSLKRYHLQEFRRGFVRMALDAQCPIIPTLIIGAEETHINLRQFKLPPALANLTLPLPLNLIPLPAKWKIIFLKPIHFPYQSGAANDDELVHELASEVREEMQQALSQEIGKRESIFR
ncbi:MAG: acyltransferase family protein [Bdellovibrionaceae bacterium]|nr:acyltransferase family protein [Pseudobdellovibrionaceae bacterium]